MTKNDMAKRDGTDSQMFGEIMKVIRQGSFPRHGHKYEELYVCLGGRATDIVKGLSATVSPGDVYIVGAHIKHEQTDMVDYRCCIFKFERVALLERAAKLHLSEKPVFRELFDGEDPTESGRHPSKGFFVDADTMRYVEQLADIMKNETDKDILDTLFLSLVAVLVARCKCKQSPEASALPKGLSEAVYYMEQNFDKPLSLETLALEAHYSVRHFTRLMRLHYGVSPMEYLDSIRMKHACDLLLGSSNSIQQIANLCGFEDNNLFARHFRAAMGISPTEYRQRTAAPQAAFSAVGIIN